METEHDYIPQQDQQDQNQENMSHNNAKVYARFTSSSAHHHGSKQSSGSGSGSVLGSGAGPGPGPGSNAMMLNTSPVITFALYRSLPILSLIDNFLGFITWTNDDLYYNFLICSGIVMIVLKLEFILKFGLFPIMIAFIFSCFAWSIQSIVLQNQDDEQSSSETTRLHEILDLLHNIATRFEILMEPLQLIDDTIRTDKKNKILKMIMCTIWITPLQIIVISNRLISLHKLTIMFLVFIITYHSPWSIATRHLLWRSYYIRKLGFYLTGIKFNTNIRSNSPFYDEKFFKILSTKDISEDRQGNVIQFEILENQRRWLALGWTDYLLPYERSNYTTVSTNIDCKAPSQEFDFLPLTHNNNQWKWLENSWTIDFEYNKNKDGEGWIYYDNNWNYPSFYDGITRYTRSRKWKRKAVLIIDKE